MFTGLSLAVGVVLYVCAVSDELRYIPQRDRGKTFMCQFGGSMYLAGISFIACNLTTIFHVNIVLTIVRENQEKDKPIPTIEKKSNRNKSHIRGIQNMQIIVL